MRITLYDTKLLLTRFCSRSNKTLCNKLLTKIRHCGYNNKPKKEVRRLLDAIAQFRQYCLFIV